MTKTINKWTKILDATSGDSSEFKSVDNLVTLKLSIDGTASSNIQAFVNEQLPNSQGFLMKIRCDDPSLGGATVNLQCKTTHADDSQFDNTSFSYTEDVLKFFEYR